MLGLRPRCKPTFLWQGALILLPVAVMSVIALLAIRRDKAAVEQEARQRAAEVANQLASGLAKRVPAHLAAYDLFSFTWLKHQSDLAKADFPPRDPYASRLAEWRAANPSLQAEEVLPNRLSFTPDGVMVWPLDYAQPPRAPAWFLRLTTEQRQAWDALVNAELTAAELTNSDAKLREFFNSKPPLEGRANADFVWLRTRLARQAGLNAVMALQRASVDYAAVTSESGLPLLSLAAAETLRLVRQSGEAQRILQTGSTGSGVFLNEILAWILDEPSVLSPMLIAQLQALVDSQAIKDNRSELSIRAAQTVWSSQQRLHNLGEALSRRWFLNGSVATNFWLAAPSGSWFCRAEPEQLKLSARNPDGVRVEQTNRVVTVCVYPKPAIEHVFAMAIQDPGISIPDYFEVNVQFENEFLTLSSPHLPTFEAVPVESAAAGSKHRTDRAARFSLAGALEDAVGHPGSVTILSEARGSFAPVLVSEISNPPPAGYREPGPESDGLAGSPQFAVQISLTNRQLLFARQQQRILLFGGLILASGFAAVVGLIAAWRSFRRQLRLSELKSNFVSSVSHELRAPIASVRLMAESLERGKISDSQKQHEYFHFIVQECRRLSSLIENVLDFSRIEQGRKQFEFEPTDIVSLARQTVKLMEAYATERQVGLALAVEDLGTLGPQLQLLADGKAIQQALINLIDNAVKHSPKGQLVAVGLEVRNGEYGMRNAEWGVGSKGGRSVAGGKWRDGVWVALWVEDHGEGIPAQEHEKIFERFYRLGSELRRQTQGVGIGLSIVKHVVEAHGGRVVVRSEVGQGSRFTIELPLESETLKSEIRHPKAE